MHKKRKEIYNLLAGLVRHGILPGRAIKLIDDFFHGAAISKIHAEIIRLRNVENVEILQFMLENQPGAFHTAGRRNVPMSPRRRASPVVEPEPAASPTLGTMVTAEM